MTATVSTSLAGSWINGAPVVTGGGLHQVINPATGQAVAEYALATSADVDQAVQLAPATATTYLARARVRSTLKDPQAALADFAAALRIAPGAPVSRKPPGRRARPRGTQDDVGYHLGGGGRPASRQPRWSPTSGARSPTWRRPMTGVSPRSPPLTSSCLGCATSPRGVPNVKARSSRKICSGGAHGGRAA